MYMSGKNSESCEPVFVIRFIVSHDVFSGTVHGLYLIRCGRQTGEQYEN